MIEEHPAGERLADDRAGFDDLVERLRAREGYQSPAAFGIGVASIAGNGAVLDVRFGSLNAGDNQGAAAVIAAAVGYRSESESYDLSATNLEELSATFAPIAAVGTTHPNLAAIEALRFSARSAPKLPVTQVPVVTFIADLGEPPSSAYDVYLRLHLLSSRRVAPRQLNLDGIFGLLSNVVWTSLGPCPVEEFERVSFELKAAGDMFQVYGVDKFPRMVDYVVPSGVRIADADRVRLGAHLADGTTVMHEGFVNYNAGTLGASMVEGRISAGVIVGENTDIGGGASIMGTLSGGGKEVISIGSECLLGANSGVGISLGDRCIVEAGLYITAGTRVTTPDNEIVKASSLSGSDDLLFRRNSVSGRVEVLPRRGTWQEGLNAELHAN